MDKLEFNFKQKVFSEFLHWVMGMSYSLWRTEAVKEIYGPDPHDERAGPETDGIASGAQSMAQRAQQIMLQQV